MIGTTAAILGAAAIGGGTALASGAMQSKAAKQSAAAIQKSTDQSSETQRYIFDQTRADNRIRQQTGDAASLMMARLMGLDTQPGAQGGQQPQPQPQATPQQSGLPTSGLFSGNLGRKVGNAFMEGEPRSLGGGMSANRLQGGGGNALDIAPVFMPEMNNGGAVVQFPGNGAQPAQGATNAFNATDWLRSTPGYDFNFNEGMRALNTGLAGQGRLQSGDAQREAMRYGQNYGDRIYNDQYNRLASISGAGQVASSANQQAGQNYANNQTNLNMNNANARASSYQNGANAWTNALGGVAGAGMWALGQYGGKQ